MTGTKFERRAAMATLLANRPDNLFVVPGLGSCTWDAFAAGDSDRTFDLWGAMGGAAMIGLGLALSQPKLRVAVITGDGEMLMGIGSLATIGVQQPRNLSIVVFDNGLYGETGRQASHTQSGVDLCAVARGSGIARVLDIADDEGLHALAGLLTRGDGPLFARVPITPDDPGRALPEKDGVAIKDRVRRAVERTAATL
jgi:thiamine pyrophosphate-dependent acetolactate synthase large subunit-like protein